jgi:hypothetical protein
MNLYECKIRLFSPEISKLILCKILKVKIEGMLRLAWVSAGAAWVGFYRECLENVRWQQF